MREPSRTVTTGGASGAIVIIILWILGLFFPTLEIPAEVAGALTLIVSTLGAWIVPDPDRRPNKHA
ncbi:hypothetical protein QP572_02360 [Brevibacterium sp. UMB10442]|nr:hypothetical protein [Brevibacterium sp. UMB10442]